MSGDTKTACAPPDPGEELARSVRHHLNCTAVMKSDKAWLACRGTRCGKSDLCSSLWLYDRQKNAQRTKGGQDEKI